MNVTLMTDASWCPESRAAGFGFWVVSSRGGRPGGGEINALPSDSTAAEMMGIVKALHQSLKWGAICPGDRVLIQTDSVNAIKNFSGNGAGLRADVQQCVGVYAQLIARAELSIEFRHVKAHSGVGDQRSKANEMCDRRAKMAMRALRARLKKGDYAMENAAPS